MCNSKNLKTKYETHEDFMRFFPTMLLLFRTKKIEKNNHSQINHIPVPYTFLSYPFNKA